jgi:hypothetical protein
MKMFHLSTLGRRQVLFGIVVLILILTTTHCRQVGEKDRAVETATTEDKEDDKEGVVEKLSFEAFLGYFQEGLALESWPDAAQAPLVLDNVFWDEDQSRLEKALEKTFKKLPAGALDFVPTQKIKQLNPYSDVIQNPHTAFDFYAFAKQRREDGWLTSIFARKKERDDRFYHEHPFFLVTYSESGKVLDSFVWWTIIHDDVQICGDAAVAKDTLLIGGKFRVEDDTLEEIFQKTILTPRGKFKTIYSNYPKSSF